MDQSENIGELAAALAKVQAQLRPARMDATNPFFSSKYATLESCWNACRDLLSSNGLAVVQSPGSDGNGRIVVRSTLVHTSGEWISATVSLRPVKDDPQAAGSAITYGRRYGLCALVGIVTNDDDDGNYATQPKGQMTSYSNEHTQRDIADKAREKREAAQKEAQKRADAEALVKDVADTLGATVVKGSDVAPPAQLENIRINPAYKTREKNKPPVKIEARFLRENDKSFLYQLLDNGADCGEIYLPKTQVHSQGTGADGRKYVWISEWIADKKVKDGKLQPEQVLYEDHDKARGDAWEEEIAAQSYDDSDIPI